MANPSREIKVPFHIGQDGGVAYTEDEVAQYTQRILAVLRTRLGERVMLPTFGSPVPDFLFEPNDPLAAADLALRAADAITTWEPNIALREVRPEISDPASGVLYLSVFFSVPPREDVFSTLVGVGGTMTETTSG